MDEMQKQIDDIMDNFDFTSVKRVMDELEWRWVGVGGIPDESQIRRSARKRLREAWERKESSMSGGLEALYREDEEGPWLELRFVVESWSTAEMGNGGN